jgi:hypothetical protein
VKLEFAGSRAFQLDDAENGEVASETIIPNPLSIVWIDVRGGDHQSNVPRLSVECVTDCDNHYMIHDRPAWKNKSPSAKTLTTYRVCNVMVKRNFSGRDDGDTELY